jgi:hypothetical protein
MYKSIMLLSIDANSVVSSQDSSAMNEPVARLNKTFFSGQLLRRSIHKIWLTNRVQSKAFKVIFVVFICAKKFFHFLSIMLNCSIEGSLPLIFTNTLSFLVGFFVDLFIIFG